MIKISENGSGIPFVLTANNQCCRCKTEMPLELPSIHIQRACHTCGSWWSTHYDLSNREQEEIAKVLTNGNGKSPKFFDEDGDPTIELSNSIYDMEHYAYAKIKHFVDEGMNRLELRAFAERLINAVQMAALTYMPHVPRSEK